MRAVAAYTRFWSGGNLVMGLAERIGFGVMTLAAQFTTGFHQNSREIGAVRIMALKAILCRGLMIHPVDPELGNRCMAGQAEFRLVLLENIPVGRTVGGVTVGAFPVGQRFMLHRSSLIGLLDVLMTPEAQFALWTPQHIFIIRRVGRMTLAALALSHRCMGGKILRAFLFLLMTVQAQLAAAVLRQQVTCSLWPVQLVALAAVPLSKRLVQTEPAAFHRGIFMAGKAEFPLAISAEQGPDLGLMRDMACGTLLRVIIRMGASAGCVPLLGMTVKAQFPRIGLEHGLLIGHMALMAGKAFPLGHRLVLAERFNRPLGRCAGTDLSIMTALRSFLFGRLPTVSRRDIILCAGDRCMTGQADALGGIRQHGGVIARMHIMTGCAFPLNIGLMHACRRLSDVVALQAQLVSLFFGLDFRVCADLMAGITLSFKHRLMHRLFQQFLCSAGMGRMTQGTTGFDRIFEMGLLKPFLIHIMA